MHAYVADLLRGLEEMPQALPDSQTPDAYKRWRKGRRPLPERLAELLASIPPEMQVAGLSLRDIQVRLAGRQKGRIAQVSELAAALRAQGFVRERKWRAEENGFRAVWKRD